MFIRSIPLRLKLIAALLLPLLFVTVYLGIVVVGALDDRAVAERQTEEIDRFEAVASFADQIGPESAIMNGGQMLELGDQRAVVDAAFANVVDPALGVAPANVERLEATMAEIQEQRSILGDTVEGMVAGLGGEVAQGLVTGPYIVGYTRFQEFSGEVSAGYEVNPDNISNTETVDLLTSYSVVLRLRNNMSATFASMNGTAPIPAEAIGEPVIRFLAVQDGRLQEAQAVVFESATPQVRAEVQQLLDSAAYATFDEGVQGLFDLTIGVAPSEFFDVVAATPAAGEVLANMQGIAAGVAQDIRTEANDTLDNANSQLFRSALIGGGLLLLVSLIVAVLYRAIRRPLKEVTDRSRRIAEVELPEVVRAMRSGEAETVPVIEPLHAESKDEIGDLVEAFNGMHRTAVDLAAEQAESRRVVATMFVNLGRRNQRLLTQVLDEMDELERDERDSARLKKLFSVDQKVTRMRRNAESLLVLAGQHTPRQWSEPAPVSDVLRAAMSEVENFDRVVVNDGIEVPIKGAVVADLTHLVAELLENALRFSPPSRHVELGAHMVRDEPVIVIIDQGVGLAADEREAFNTLVAEAATSEETPSKRLGHYVVGRLGARHGILVEFREHPVTLGTVALVKIAAAVASEADLKREVALSAAPAEAATAELPVAADDEAADLDEDVTIEMPVSVNPQEDEKAETPEPAAAEADAQVTAERPAPAPVANTTDDATAPPATAPPAPAPVAAQPAPAPAPAPRPEPRPVSASAQSPQPATVSPARRVPGTTFDAPPAERVPERARVAAPVSPKSAAIDRRPLDSRQNVEATASLEQSALGAAATPARRVPGQNLPEQLRKPAPVAASAARSEGSDEQSSWTAFAGFQESGAGAGKDNS